MNENKSSNSIAFLYQFDSLVRLDFLYLIAYKIYSFLFIRRLVRSDTRTHTTPTLTPTQTNGIAPSNAG